MEGFLKKKLLKINTLTFLCLIFTDTPEQLKGKAKAKDLVRQMKVCSRML